MLYVKHAQSMHDLHLPSAKFETLNPVLPIWRYFNPGKVVLTDDAPAPATFMMLHSLLNLLRWVLLPDSKSMSSIASIEAIGARPLQTVHDIVERDLHGDREERKRLMVVALQSKR